MAISMKDDDTVSCAYYVALDEALFLQQDIPLAGIELVEMLILHIEPTTVLVPIRSPDKLVEFLEAGAQDFRGNRDREGYSLNPRPLFHPADSPFQAVSVVHMFYDFWARRSSTTRVQRATL